MRAGRLKNTRLPGHGASKKIQHYRQGKGMIRIGEIQKLKMIKRVDFGIYLSSSGDDRVLLPKKQVPSDIDTGDEIEVFVYLDSEDRPVATVNTPLITVGETAMLTVKEVTKMGAFLDMGLERDLLLPFREQTYPPEVGHKVLVTMYRDKTGRLAASMKVYSRLQADPPYGKDDEVEGMVYEISRNFGAFVAVDNKYSGLIPARELPLDLKAGETVHARVTAKKLDGKLDLSVQKKAYLQMNDDADRLLEMMDKNGGRLRFTDKAEPRLIKEKTGMSKSAFKRAVGHLLKEKKISITETEIVRKKK